MSLFVQITSAALRDARTHNYEEILRNLAKRVEESGAHNLEYYGSRLLKKRYRSPELRLIAKESPLAEGRVLSFLRLLTRDGAEYRQFKAGGYELDHLPGISAQEISGESLQALVRKRMETPPVVLNPPDEYETSFLYGVPTRQRRRYQDIHCCETSLWAEKVLDTTFQTRLSDTIRDCLLESIDAPLDPFFVIRSASKREFGIVIRRVKSPGLGDKIILFAPFKNNPPLDTIRERYPELIRESPLGHEDFLRLSKRVYPLEIIFNDNAWALMEKDDSDDPDYASLGLSQEEVSIIEPGPTPEGRYPLFVNGHAGSGKSTILHYLFAEHARNCLDHLGSRTADATGVLPHPVLFAANDDLLEKSRECVSQILLAGQYTLSDAGAPLCPAEAFKEKTAGLLKNFHAYLRSLIPSSDPAAGIFANPSAFIGFAEFKRWWERSFGYEPSARKLYGPGISWHVIRSFIKGYDFETWLEPDDYDELPRAQRSVSGDSYRIIFSKVWAQYRNFCKENNLWDHQDLARHILLSGLAKPAFPAIFCDEAQDFTRIEIEILRCLSLFRARRMRPQDIPYIPIAFVGDPFQTLNPTGFRWESVKAHFHQSLALDHGPRAVGDIKYHELSYNYRSSSKIVKFCNAIQLLRKTLFKDAEISPQIPWRGNHESAVHVTLIKSEDHRLLSVLRERSELRIIPPCEENEEIHWARENGLEGVIKQEEGVPKNITAPSRVKGLEYNSVLLFGFGDACPPPLLQAILESRHLDSDAALDPLYFLNRLYVAASRARKRLFIVDSSKAIETFWARLFDPDTLETIILQTGNPGVWESSVAGPVIGQADEILSEKPDDPARMGEKTMRQALARKDAFSLRQAAQSFDDAALPSKATECRAWAAEIDGDHLKAAEFWLKISRHDRATLALWREEQAGWRRLLSLKHLSEIASSQNFKFAEFLLEKKSINDCYLLLRQFEEHLAHSRPLLEEVLAEAAWKKALNDTLSKALQDGSSSSNSGLFAAILGILLRLRETKSLSFDPVLLGSLAFEAGDMPRAIEEWERIQPEKRSSFERKFRLASARTTPYPDSLLIYKSLLDSQPSRTECGEILRLFRDHSSTPLRPQHHAVIASAFAATGQISEAIASARLGEDLQTLHHLLIRATDSPTPSLPLEACAAIADLLASASSWGDLINFLKTGLLRGIRLKNPERKKFEDWLAGSLFDRAAIVLKIFSSLPAGDRLTRQNREDLEQFLLEQFPASLFAGRPSVADKVHPLLVGKILESCGLFINILPFYEQIAKNDLLSSGLRETARRRHVRVKLAQSALYERQDRLDQAYTSKKEAFEEAAALGFDHPSLIPDEFPDPLPPPLASGWPNNPPPPEPHSGPRQTAPRRFSLGPISATLGPGGIRLNLDHSETFEQAALFPEEPRLLFEGRVVEPAGPGLYHIPAWRLDIAIGSAAIALTLPNGPQLSIPLGNSQATQPQ